MSSEYTPEMVRAYIDDLDAVYGMAVGTKRSICTLTHVHTRYTHTHDEHYSLLSSFPAVIVKR
jgi:hypothetical protein